MNKLFSVVTLAGLLWLAVGCSKESASNGSSAARPGAPTFGFVDPARIINGVGWNVDAQKNIQATETEARRQIEARIAPIRAAFEQKKAEIFAAAMLTKDQIETLNTKRSNKADMEKMGLSAKQIDELVAASAGWQNDLAAANNLVQQAVARQNTLINNAYQEVLGPLVREVAKSTGRTVVLPAAQAVYFDASMDMTDDIIKEIQNRPGIKVTFPDIPKAQISATSQPADGAANPATQTSVPAPTTKP